MSNKSQMSHSQVAALRDSIQQSTFKVDQNVDKMLTTVCHILAGKLMCICDILIRFQERRSSKTSSN